MATLNAEALTAIEKLRELGVTVGVFGKTVYVATKSDALFKTIAKHYGATVDVVVSTYKVACAANVARFMLGDYVVEMQGPQRRPTAFDWAKHRSAS